MNLRDLLSISNEFEAGLGRPCEEPPAIAALRVLAGLEPVARASLYTQLTPRAPGAPAAALRSPSGGSQLTTPSPGRIAIPPAPPAPSLWSTRSKTYRPALGDPSVIEALLKFRHQVPPIEKPALPSAALPRHELASSEIRPASMERLSAKDLELCFPFEPSSKLLRPRQ